MTPPTPGPTYYVSNQLEYFGYYVGYVLKVDGVIIDTYGTLSDGTAEHTWTLQNSDDSMSAVYYTPGFYVVNRTAYLEVHVNDKLYRYNGTTWECMNGTTESSVVLDITYNYGVMKIDADLLAVFANGSVAL